MPEPWTNQDSTLARAQGWDVFDIWDSRLTFEIQKDDQSNTFLSDEAARAFVYANSQTNHLCRKAWTIVFKSKVK